ncbi:mitochondrial 50S ribosomal protein L9, putative [Pediculus humanus corporis]|uniref:Mitochondrial 50S ribosomal protein L9, putative n=1 Tax=Pediculus humanus subsp. corporis TaxID=121224 RepID=E0VV84_PEDHC|nr:mitochondrial 50S ribosomal protein L9, putative [Pediculus humanus corporis]EEB17290.1 mitochondrial 50S ribosomal protein L9, putative [Pediculus humanus corporis]
MWKNVNTFPRKILQCKEVLIEIQRNAFVLKRLSSVRLSKLGAPPKKLEERNFLYETIVKTESVKKPPIELVLIKDVPGVGMLGDNIKINCYNAYKDFLLPKLAIYADSPEAINIKRKKEDVQYSSIYCQIVEKYLTLHPLQITLNQKTNWTLEPWHIKIALRQQGIIANENCIKLPDKTISGPNVEIENKDFIVHVKMNDSETFKVRCRIYHIDNSTSRFINIDSIYSESTALFPEEQDMINAQIKKELELKQTLKNSQ